MARYIKGFNLLGTPTEDGQKLAAVYGLGVMGTTDDPDMKKELKFVVSEDPELCSPEELKVLAAVFERSYKKLLGAQQAVILAPPKKDAELLKEAKSNAAKKKPSKAKK